ncbi:unnamed protein product [Gadus morhua 'NCC']
MSLANEAHPRQWAPAQGAEGLRNRCVTTTVGDRAKTLSPPDACFSTLALALLWLLLGSWLALNSLSRLAG